MPQVAARAGIHGGDQLKAGRKLGLAGRARNADDARFHGLAQDIEDPALEFGDFIEKQHTAVCQRDFSRARQVAAVNSI